MIRISPINRTRFFVSELMHRKSKTNILSKLKFGGKILLDTATGKERFSLKYLCEYKLKHLIITLRKDDFIMP